MADGYQDFGWLNKAIELHVRAIHLYPIDYYLQLAYTVFSIYVHNVTLLFHSIILLKEKIEYMT